MIRDLGKVPGAIGAKHELSVWETGRSRSVLGIYAAPGHPQRECRFRNRKTFHVLLSSDVIQLNHVRYADHGSGHHRAEANRSGVARE
jgi:hypothetical protein